jgi:glycosyltransferase involved in cell wall biosynthesis
LSELPHAGISVCVPTRDRPQSLRFLLYSLMKQLGHPAFEVVVVDDGSYLDYSSDSVLDSLQEELRRAGAPVRWIKNEQVVGMAASRNLAMEAARYDWILKMDDDHYCDADLLYRLAETASKEIQRGGNPGCIGTIFPFVRQRKITAFQDAVDVAPRPPGRAGLYLSETGRASKDHEFVQLLPTTPSAQPIPAQLLRGVYLHRKGPVQFDPSLSQVSHTEDTRFSWAMYCAGYDNWIEPRAMCMHLQCPEGGARFPDADDQRRQDLKTLKTYMDTCWEQRAKSRR